MKTQSFAKNHKHQVVLKSKIHFKLYKKGKSWLITGLSLSLFGGVLLLDQQKVFADSSTSQTASSADSASEQSNKSETVQNPNITPSNSNGSSNQPLQELLTQHLLLTLRQPQQVQDPMKCLRTNLVVNTIVRRLLNLLRQVSQIVIYLIILV
ncbi:KxYKxGKxW signal peptide domain-containing protein [Secundilactobacillus collinoides]|uniref:KxYKxGKxW signal peptide domain-containing protein n=1 Tax=Secundilactobacillus collinoides TaxID=33960 RepID=UPI00158587BF|nr:KxYKxGKxW signal peptide domain-containing protein [Secundilactobacillus collinoides]